MKKNITLFVLCCGFIFSAGALAQVQQAVYQDEDTPPESFTILLKDEWSFLNEAVTQLKNETENKGEFETTEEFQTRITRSRDLLQNKLNTHLKETKLDRRVFGLWYKATLVSYNADAEIYSVKCATIIEAPYNIPTVDCLIPPNPYVDLSDSIRGGYRTSSIFLKFHPDFEWKVGRSEAQAAKGVEANLYFKVHFMVDLLQAGTALHGQLKIIAKDIALMNKSNNYVYWKSAIP
ncbi:MAG: hypothetical protein EHM64_02480 [Ignavibacteriae bacterium]|nr:MAG: hypothetical protein EHM64_02480 [Ignavibacteriota bacterium]